jgi:crotonobetainyl-CoA:carnitine CoA-transferase CaiB-like acyl-CoA transferase
VGGALGGVKIIELAGIGPGLYVGMLLADMGDADAKPVPTGDVLARVIR